jgi:hypothetical protein
MKRGGFLKRRTPLQGGPFDPAPPAQAGVLDGEVQQLERRVIASMEWTEDNDADYAIDLDRLRHDPLMKVAVGRCPDRLGHRNEPSTHARNCWRGREPVGSEPQRTSNQQAPSPGSANQRPAGMPNC